QNTAWTVNGGALDLNGHVLTASSLSGTGGGITLGSGHLTVNQSADTAYAGALTSTTGILYKQGGGTLTLSGNNAVHEIHANAGALVISGQSTASGMGVGRADGATGAVVVSGGNARLHAGGFLTVGDNPGSTGA